MQSFTVFFLLPLIFTVHAEVVQQFKNTCDQFFYERSVPELDASKDYVHICQRFKNKYRFATLYDTANRIPVYSAYIYERKEQKEPSRKSRWFIEPQLVDQNWENSMMTARELRKRHNTSTTVDDMGNKQATNYDYTRIDSYNRGHLNPNQHHSGLGRSATFTLTNVVPQNIKLNAGSWNKYETKLRDIFKGCKTAFVLVGAIPSKNSWVKGRVNIPEYMWHAYCCVDNNDRPYKSGAAAVRNEDTAVVECSLNSLDGFFAKVRPKINQLFLKDCDAPIRTGEGDCAGVVP